MTKLEAIQKSIDKALAEVARLKVEKDKMLASTKATCCCGAEFAVRDLEYIQTHWYVSPSGCTEGDYWNEGEGQWQCPKCGHVNRLYNNPAITALRRYFKSERECYCKIGWLRDGICKACRSAQGKGKA